MKEPGSKTKSVNPVRPKEIGEFNDKIAANNTYLNYRANNNIQNEVKMQSSNISSKSMVEKDTNKDNNGNKSSTSLNTSGIGMKKTDLNKYLNINK
jgi:hypothetical protein